MSRELRTGIATVCLSGTLDDKLSAAAAAGFDGVEIFEPDLVASPMPPGEVRLRCADLGLSIDLYQPFRDLDSTDPDRFAANLRRAERKFDLMEELGADTVLVCSSVAHDAVADLDRLAGQLHALGERAGARGLRIAYEALAWGKEVSTYDRSWEAVRRADHPAVGLCLDSFHILSRGSDPAAIAGIPGDKLFFLQLADAPHLSMDVLQWSRHHRLFPGQGAFDLPGFLAPVLAAGYAGPLSLEVFNDVFRQADPDRAAIDAHRSLLALAEATSAPDPIAQPAPDVRGPAFVELSADDSLAPVLSALGFARTGTHRTKPVERWEQGAARILVNRSGGPAAVAALAVESADPAAAARRAIRLDAKRLPREHGPAEADLAAVTAPDGTALFFCRTGNEDDWTGDFVPTGATADGIGITGIDHIGLAQPFDHFDEAALFYRTVLGLEPAAAGEFAAPFGLVRSRAVADPHRRIRLALTVSLLRRGEWAPGVSEPQYIALAVDDLLAAAQAARAAGAPLLAVPDNYYADLDARLDLPAGRLAAYRELGVLHEHTAEGDYLQACTEVLGGRVFLALVQRLGGHDGYGWTDAPVRMAAHRRRRLARTHVPA
ncbi:sugar phosphate isomerase/epimerase and 4-hydroxyphenylpyruvate domain-containing protein [Amycolatopsis dendrobii]|uniref:3-dehydroshikimate dehydratase n=1 Tax=Amycolatopsis dendrobii TaxID=2760662 RepID=A0A7W3W6Y4_9PSEU|nr:sugar phosphate isomerase/epimerase and 4-hydroxyphenylpyruvate domain-containing protein [Amycolatopsis dendrobii]MBB1159936.1 sugar phosphate isomerase/epimerase and 4-hydroxyphenylpyruvate domain-containing protein [Amycolatopsis dendrobii]